MSIARSAARPFPIQRRTSPTLVAAAVAAALAGAMPTAHAADEDSIDEVTVTGSRIVRRDLTAASPVVTVESQVFENISTVGVESALNKLPQFHGATGTQFVATDVQASAFNSPGISSLNLRGLGPNRNLVLIDGRRAQPANATLTVDVNSIPAAAIENVEIISGGASSVYGADAIAGVVNFKLKNRYEGFSVDAQTGTTEQGGGTETRISALMGANFAGGKGNVLAAIEWAKRDAVMQADRDFYVAGWDDPGTTGAALNTFGQFVPSPGNAPSQTAVNTVFGTTGTAVNNLTNFFFNRDGTLFKQSPARRFNSQEPGTKLQSNNALGQADRTGMASSPLTRYSLFSRGTFAFNDHVSAFIQGNLSSLTVSQVLGYAPATSFWGASVPRDAQHPVPAELAALLDSRLPNPGAARQLDRVLDYIGPRRSRNDSDVFQVMAGLNGDLGLADWTWEVYGSHGETRITNYLNGGFVSLERYRRLIAAPNYGRGYTVGDPSGILGYKITCTSGLPVFENFQPSQDCIDAMSSRMKNITSLKQNIAEANLQGRIANLPAGELRGAFGLTYRQNTFTFDPDVLNDTESVLDGPVGLFASNDTRGETNVKEVNGELLVPLLKDLPAIKSLSLELGGRYSDYNTAGGVTTWKALTNWGVNSYVAFRGGIQVATRAPNVAELFTGPTVTVAGFPNSDPCAISTIAPWGNVPGNPNRAKVQALCSALNGTGTSVFDANPNTFLGGNGGFFPIELENRRGNSTLQSETARTLTVGTVLRSPFESAALSSMTAQIDYYRIEIADAIAPLPGPTIYENCFNVTGTNPTYDVNNEYCRLIKRDGVTGGRVSVDAPYSNLGAIETSGLDLQFNWRSDLSEIGLQSVPGALSVGIAVNYLFEYQTQPVPGARFVENKGTLAQNGQYRYISNTNLGYILGGWNFGLEWRHLPSVENAAKATTPTTTIRPTESYDLFNLSANWSVTRQITLRAGVDNLLDKDPPIVGYNPGVNNARGATSPGFYDILGRRYYAGVKVEF